MLALATPASAYANAPNHDLRQGPRVISAVAGGNPAASPDAWRGRGGVAPRLVDGRWRVVSNTTLVSPSVPVPPGGAAVAVRHRAVAGSPVLDVRALGGGIHGTLEPGRKERLSWIWLPGSHSPEGSLLFDPTGALGRSVDVGRLGPVAHPIPGWTVTTGAPRLGRVKGRRVVVARERVRLLSRSFATGPGAARIEIEARGSGVVRLTSGGRRAVRRVGSGWRRISVPVPRGRSRARVAIEARPGARDLQIRVIGRIVRRTAIRGLGRKPGGGVRGRIVPRGGGLPVEVRDRSGRLVDRGRTGRDGRFQLRGAAGRLRIVTPGDLERLRGSWTLS